MDLNFIKDQLSDFATFGKNIDEFLQKPIELLKGLTEWFNADGPSTDADKTSSVFTSSK